jgi:hypothetical protein
MAATTLKVDAKTLKDQKTIAQNLFDDYTLTADNKDLITDQTLKAHQPFMFDNVQFSTLLDIEQQFKKYKKRLNQIKSRRMPLLFGLDKRNADLYKIQNFLRIYKDYTGNRGGTRKRRRRLTRNR